MAESNKLTQKKIDAAKPLDKAYKLYDGGGLFLFVHPNGGKYWRLKYRFGGKEKTLAIGVYPLVTLKAARESAFEAKKLLHDGLDPSAQKQSVKKAAKMVVKGQGILDLAEAWYDSRVGKKSRNTLLGDSQSLVYIRTFFKSNMDINELTARDMADFVEWLNAKDVPARADRVLQIAAAIWDYAVSKGIASSERRNPTDTAKALLTRYVSTPEPHLSVDDLPLFFYSLLKDDKITAMSKYLVLLTALLAPRNRSIVTARWSQVDFERRILFMPAESMKMKNDFLMPLSDWAVSLLTELKAVTGSHEFVFPAMRHDSQTGAVGIKLGHQALKRCGFDGRHKGKPNTTMHGFRHLMTNICAVNGKDILTTDLALGHVSKAALQKAGFDSLPHYLTAQDFHLEERRELAQWYSDYLRWYYDQAVAQLHDEGVTDFFSNWKLFYQRWGV
ncbi:DUF4102 domain-containing protein [Neisseria weixii]|uniref:DUF4102 domain-containing protein n=1 Tax=Neisseria weixii TaxID=1853276 RepID=A0A3N4N2L8_9NEIS|nr:integrase arm-type DNA-binding domain-containing protein [Neisseria weixii]RPD90484.1 DUF4102 domain-containing protein [Neisseria weixii]RPD90574.1 DUF4102 domain-containing protein [Neisseria weixii]